MNKDKKQIINKRRRLQPRIYDSSYVYCRCHLKALKDFISLLYQDIKNPAVLDIGCGDKPLLSLFHEVQYIGIDMDAQSLADFIIDCNKDNFPLKDCSIDAVLLSNSLEHIYNTNHLIDEISRVLKPGGLIFFSVPMNYPVHAHPDDYFRFTPYYFKRRFQDFDIIQLNVSNSVFSTPLLLVSQLFDTFFAQYVCAVPVLILNLSSIFIDWITKIISASVNLEILTRFWSAGPLEINGIIRKKTGF
ncbi:SAM-dependent methyltransferase [Desulfonema limicola]|uniref:SAM-dependent methyltransferase n=1 Tax=Desulfonema limicola TaxID=45656 RepID=A0A975GHW9_9BACT|nr:class I SAM-dependent methyltransferase [Desulfonema limicola]QTA81897.1 SAM-dependent methyltransferase [Desulfonema limicola]